MRRTTLPAPAEPEEDPNWRPGSTSREEYLAFQAAEDALAFQEAEDAMERALALGYNQKQGWPGEVLPYPPGNPRNPRQEQLEATARYYAAPKETRGTPPSVDPTDFTPIDLRWAHGPLPYKCGIADRRDREDYGEPG